MGVTKVSLDCDKIVDWRSFHEEFARVFAFPEFYGKNMNAWIDCMTYVDDPDSGMSTVHCERGSVLALELLNVESFRRRCRELYEAVVEGVAFVNWRRLETGDPAVLTISFWH
jgi:RNAse (barnase) inhibitor barstar